MRIDGRLPMRHPVEFDPRLREEQLGTPSAPEAGEGVSFGRALERAVSDVNELQLRAESQVDAFISGEDVPLHEVVLAQEEAEISFRLLLEVRDQMVRAYQEIIRTPM